MSEYSHQLKIPADRIPVIIGSSGETKEKLEQETNTTISVDSKEGDVEVSGEEPVKLFIARDIVKAIGRGFNPEVAGTLIKNDFCFELISIMDYADTKKDLLRIKGRVIGREGKARKTIESLCDVYIAVYGKTVGIIGEAQHVSVARRAIESLLSGSPHANIYKWLENQRKELKKLDLIGPQLVKEQLKEEETEDDTAENTE